MKLSHNQIERIEGTAGGRFQHVALGGSSLFLDNQTKLVFRYIAGGTYSRGMSDDEEKAARAIKEEPPITFESMRPVASVSVADLLVAIKPLSCVEYFELSDESTEEQREYCESWGLMHTPSSLPIEMSSKICGELGLRLPNESEWEYFTRGGTNSLFFFGNSVPENDELEKILNAEFVPNEGAIWGLHEKDFEGKVGNPYGLYGLFSAEACSDDYLPSYDSSAEPTGHVVRGGGSIFWPWQADEWIWCMSSMRISSEMIFEDKCCAFRPVYELE